MKHLPFDSLYRADYEVVEQRQGNTRLYPHTDQLPTLLRAIHLEFYTGLQARTARVDHRANDFDKIVLQHSSLCYCHYVNAGRKDELRLFSLPDENLVARPTIVQQITEQRPRGLIHRFKFYGGKDFIREFYLSGKRVVFADHVLQRFSSRTEHNVGEDLSNFLMAFFQSPMIAMPVGPGRAFITQHFDSILAFTYQETDTEYIVTTCLTINEINSVESELPPHTINIHYNLPFIRPSVRNWVPFNYAMKFYRIWENKTPAGESYKKIEDERELRWHEIGHFMRDSQKKQGHGPGSKILFVDHLPGPQVIECLPNTGRVQYDEMATFKLATPEDDWEAILAERAEEGTYAPARRG